MKLHEIKDTPYANTKKKRVGRGRGSGLGKTAGRGNKGYKARSGSSVAGFEGGQTPIYRRLPKHGFTPINRNTYYTINLGVINTWCEQGRINESDVINYQTLKNKRLIKGKQIVKVKILGNGELTHKLNFEIQSVSGKAKDKIESVGGNVSIRMVKVKPVKEQEELK